MGFMSFGVGAVVDLGHGLRRQLRISLGGGEAGVAQQFLDGTKVGAIGEQMGGKGVAKAMGMKRRIAREDAGVEFYDASGAPVGEAGALVI